MVSPEDRSARAEPVLRDQRRLSTVRATELLDTSNEETFDALSRLAVTLVGAPVSFLSIVDEARDFYKSQSGLPAPLASERELHGRTFCHYTLTAEDPLVIDDTLADPVWQAVPSVQSLGVRAYLGVPLIIEGQPIGSFCVVDMRPRAWTSVEVETLVQLAQSAAREIQLRAALKEAMAKADRANALARANEELLAVVAHDLRSPLQVIGLSNAMLKRSPEMASLPHVKRIDVALAAMKRLVDDLLTTHVTAGQERALFATLPASKLLADAADTMGTVAERAGVYVVLGPIAETSVSVDYAQLLRILCNLIGNCVKYCPAGSTVVLSASAVDDDTVLQVSDDGPGMSAEEQSHAFERGWQGQAGRAGGDGAGLGLSIVRTLVEKNQGQVDLRSEPGRGTTVSVRLPRLPGVRPAIAVKPPATAPS